MARTQMNVERMQEAISLLRKIDADPNVKFDYSHWGNKISCGTIACAGGYMTLHKPFQEQGLEHEPYNLGPVFEGKYGEFALAKFLGLTDNQADTAFISLHEKMKKQLRKITAGDVANYLEKLLNAKLKRDQRISMATREG